MGDGTGALRISAIICAYNEGARLSEVLSVVAAHPALLEVIVVDDGSSDDTAAQVAGFPGVRLISYSPNRGKTYAMSRGVEAARGDHVMFLDADLAGLGQAELDQLIAPVAAGRAQVSISLRSNSLAIYRLLGLDFVSGERVLPIGLLRPHVAEMEGLPRWGAEAFINDLIIAEGLSIEVVDWAGVINVRKYAKFGLVRGVWPSCG